MGIAFSTLSVGRDHSLPVGSPAEGATFTVKVLAGDTVYYADTWQVSAASNQGSLTAGQSASFTVSQWLRSASQSDVLLTVPDPPLPVGELPASVALVSSLPVVDLISYYGLKGDGSDETTALTNAFTDAFTNGHAIGWSKVGAIFGASATIAITSEVSVFGSGSSGSNLDNDTGLFTRALGVFRWLGASGGGPMFYVNSASRALYGMQWQGFAIDGSLNASQGLVLDRVRMSDFRSMRIGRCQTNCLAVTTSSATANDNTQNCDFEALRLEGRVAGCIPLSLTGNEAHGGSGNANVCATTWKRILVDHSGGTAGSYAPAGGTYPAAAGPPAIEIVDADSNDLHGVRVIFRGAAASAPGSGGSYGLYFGTRARENHFYHLEPGNNGTYHEANSDASTTACNHIWGYNRENGQAAPTLATGAVLHWQEIGRNGSGVHYPGDLRARRIVFFRAATSTGVNFSIDASVANVQEYTLTANVTLTAINNAPSASPVGGDRSQMLILTIVQDGTGSRTLAWPANVKFAGAVAPTLTTTAARRDTFTFVFNGTAGNWYEVGRAMNVG